VGADWVGSAAREGREAKMARREVATSVAGRQRLHQCRCELRAPACSRGMATAPRPCSTRHQRRRTRDTPRLGDRTIPSSRAVGERVAAVTAAALVAERAGVVRAEARLRQRYKYGCRRKAYSEDRATGRRRSQTCHGSVCSTPIRRRKSLGTPRICYRMAASSWPVGEGIRVDRVVLQGLLQNRTSNTSPLAQL